MKFDRVAAFDMLTAGIAAIALVLLLRMIVAALADEPPSPPGFVRLDVCATATTDGVPAGVSEWGLVAASSIVLIGNPKGSPDGCVRVSNLNNRRIYVYGDEYTIAAKVSRALAQLPCGEGPVDDLPIDPAGAD